MNREREKVVFILIGFASVLVLGTLGYMALEGWGFTESLYMTVITLTTVGFGEVHPLGPVGQIFTTGLIVLGVGMAAYTASVVGQFVLDGTLARLVRRRRMEKRISGLTDHCIVCGYGRTGREVVKILRAREVPFVVIDREAELIAELVAERIPAVGGNAHDNETLERAGIERARALVACVSSDAENVFVALTARSMRPDIPISTRCELPDSEEKLLRAGATHVVNPFSMAGRHLVASVYRPAMLKFIESAAMPGGTQDFEEMTIPEDSSVVGKSLGDAGIGREFGVSILVLKRQDGTIVQNPGAGTRLEARDTILAMGQLENLKRLADWLRS